MSRPVLFVVGAGPQLDSARRVSVHLRGSAELLDLWTSMIVGVGRGENPGHIAPVTLGRMRAVAAAVRQWAKSNPDGLLVAPQDVGLLYRRAIAAGRKAGLVIVLMPDGAVSDAKTTQRSLRAGAVPAADSVLRGLGVVAGEHGVMAASRPDLVLSWGPAWNGVYTARQVGSIENVGNPRADDLGSLPLPQDNRLLVCSQPMWHAAIGGDPVAATWYRFLERILVDAPSDSVRVRLHPWERDRLADLPIGHATRAVLTEGTSFHDDLGWSGAVLSWASTTMLEAAGAGRPVISVTVNEAAAEMARSYVFQRDPRMVMVSAADLPDYPSVVAAVDKARGQQSDLATDYLVNVGSAAEAAASALDGYPRSAGSTASGNG